MGAFFKTTRYLLKAQLKSPFFHVLLAVVFACALLPLAALPPAGKAAVICDNDGSALSRGLVSKAMDNKAMKLEEADGEDLPSAFNRLRSGVVEAVFVVGEGYGESIVSGEYRDVVKLYLSPYSTSARTFSDSVAAIVMSQWLEHAAVSEAEKRLGKEAGREAERLFAAGGSPIMQLETEDQAIEQGEAFNAQAQNALFLLAAFSCFLTLCLSGTGGQDRDGLLERFKSRGWSTAAYTFARPASWALAPAAAALIPCVFLAVAGEPLSGLMSYALFIFYATTWVGISAALNCLTRNPTAQLTFASVLAILNAIFSYPSGLFQSAGPVRFAFPGWWFTQALGQAGDWLQVLPLLAFALAAGAAGLLAIKMNSARN